MSEGVFYSWLKDDLTKFDDHFNLMCKLGENKSISNRLHPHLVDEQLDDILEGVQRLKGDYFNVMTEVLRLEEDKSHDRACHLVQLDSIDKLALKLKEDRARIIEGLHKLEKLF